MDVAFRNPDGSTALVVHNENDDPRTFAVAQGGSVVRLHAARRRARDVRLAEGAALDDGYRLLDPPAGPKEAVDDDATTTWTRRHARASTSAARSACAGSCSTPAPTRRRPARLHAFDEHRRRPVARGRHGHRLRPAHHDRRPGDAGAVPARRLRTRPRRSRTCGSTAEEESDEKDPAVGRAGVRRRGRAGCCRRALREPEAARLQARRRPAVPDDARREGRPDDPGRALPASIARPRRADHDLRARLAPVRRRLDADGRTRPRRGPTWSTASSARRSRRGCRSR